LKKVGVFGGTFDPIHHGHLVLAREARETFDLDVVKFIPASASPHKMTQISAPPEARLEMLRSALNSEPGFECDMMELERPAPSYTVETIERLSVEDETAQFFYLIGDDNLSQLPTWHRFEDLSQMVQFVVLNRTGSNLEHSYPMIGRRLDISATEIRARVAASRSIRYLVPPAVEEIIRKRQLYRGTPS